MLAAVLVIGAFLVGMPAAFAAAPSWPSSQYMGVLQNVPFTIPIAVSSSTTLPLTSMTVVTTPANTAGFGLANIDLVHGTADMVGTYTAAANGSSTSAVIKATNASGNSNGTFTLEAYTCSWNTGGSPASTTTVFDAKQSEYVTGSQSAFGAPITGGVTAGSSTLLPTCADLDVPGLGASTLTLSNPFSGTITPTNNDNSSAESDMNVGCGIVSILGTKTGNYSGSNCNGSRTVPATWANGGTLSLSIGSQSDKGDTNTALTSCPPSQAAVNAGLVGCTITGSTGSSSYSWNFSSDTFFYAGQPVPQQSTFTMSTATAVAGHAVTITGGTNWWGSAQGAPVAGTGHTQSGAYYTIPAPSVYVGTTRGTAVLATSSVTLSKTTYACGQASSSVAPNPCTFTPSTISGNFTLPSSLAPGPYNVYIDAPNTTPLMGNGPNDAYQTTTGHSLGTDEAVGSINVVPPPAITSAASASGAEGDPFSFTVTTSATPAVTSITKTGALPSGVTLTNNGDGTATIAGTPGTGSTGVYPITISADNGLGAPAHQTFVLTVNLKPAITSAPSTTAATGDAFSFSITADGVPTPSISESGALPTGVNFLDNGNGTATLSGTPAAGTQGSYPLTITANNGIGSATQNFTLVVQNQASITSASAATATEGDAFSFLVTSTGSPTPAVSHSGALPAGLSFVSAPDGTATISGTPAAGTQGLYPITIFATNGVDTPATQSFVLTVQAAPVITSADNTSATEADAFSFQVTTTGLPAPSLTQDGALPDGVNFVDNGDGTATLSGTPSAGTAGTYPITITASNGVHTDAVQNFTLQVNVGPAITSADNDTVAGGASFTFEVTTTGVPTPSLAETGALPGGVSFVDNGDGTATISGNIPTGELGDYPISITADNGVDVPAVQAFTLTVDPVVSVATATINNNESNAPAGHNVAVTVNLSEPSPVPVTVHYATNDGPGAHAASAGSDYLATSGTLTIAANHTSANVMVRVYGDTTVEFDESFSLTISAPDNALLGAPDTTVVTIVNDDSSKITVTAGDVVEGNAGVTPVTVTISMNNPSAEPTTVHWSTVDGTAVATPTGRDYVAASGDLTFAPGELTKTVSVNVRGDTTLEDTQYFKVALSGAGSPIAGVVTTSGPATVNIINDEIPTFKVSNATAIEGNFLVFKPTLNQRYYQALHVCWITLDGTAKFEDGDFVSIWQCGTVQAGSKAVAVVAVQTLFDQTVEPGETIQLQVYGQDFPGSKTAKGTIKANRT